ncbi:Nn.00g022220.m01.CDS01 [Neocucurbitaria sp. VM-36]
MKSAVILALTSSTLAVPFGNVMDAMFGTHNEARQVPHPDQMPSFHPIGTGSGTGLPFPTALPTATGAFPTASGGFHHGHHGHGHKTKSLAIDYELAPTAIPKIGKVAVEKRQAGGSGTSLPSFTLVNPSDAVPVPTSTEDGSAVPLPTSTDGSDLPFPTEDPESPFPFPSGTGGLPFPTGDLPFPTGDLPFPTGDLPFPTGGLPFPTGGFPGTGIPSLPTTLETVTRGPQPTAVPELPGFPGDNEDGETGSGDMQSWLDWLAGLFGGKSETVN